MTLSSLSVSAPLGVGVRMVNLSAPYRELPGLPVIVFADEYQQLMGKPPLSGRIHEAPEVLV